MTEEIKYPEEVKELEIEKSISDKPITWKDLDEIKFQRLAKSCPDKMIETKNDCCIRRGWNNVLVCKKEKCPLWYWRIN